LDFHVNRLLRPAGCGTWTRYWPERLRTATGRAGSVSAVDAVVAGLAGEQGGVVLTTDPGGAHDRPR
jgi:hypothetical protein